MEVTETDAVTASFLARSLLLKARTLLSSGSANEMIPLAEQAREILNPLVEKEWCRRENLAECLRILANETNLDTRWRENHLD